MNKFLFLLFIPFLSHALDFTKGSGSKFMYKKASGESSDLSIYIADKKDNDLYIEYHFATKSILPTEMWQQYKLKVNSNHSLTINGAYIKTAQMEKAEALEDKYLHFEDTIQVEDFLFTKKEDIEKFKIGSEKIEVPAGSLIADHYRKTANDQIIDFWISSEAGPISLVKLKSASKAKANQNYTVELKSLLKNVTKIIEPENSVPMSDQTKKLYDNIIKK